MLCVHVCVCCTQRVCLDSSSVLKQRAEKSFLNSPLPYVACLPLGSAWPGIYILFSMCSGTQSEVQKHTHTHMHIHKHTCHNISIKGNKSFHICRRSHTLKSAAIDTSGEQQPVHTHTYIYTQHAHTSLNRQTETRGQRNRMTAWSD